MSGHTPGPWRFGKPCDSVVSDAQDTRIESHVDYYGGNLIAESVQPSNRALIAAAPELLAELRNMIAWCGHRDSADTDDSLLPIDQQPPEVQSAMRAVAKVTGGTA